MEHSIVINGFHGTNEKSADQICDKKFFESKYREDHWLGQGIYFFDEDYEQAMSWGLLQAYPGQKAVVLMAEINVGSAAFLNLNSRQGIFKFRKLKRDIQSVLEENEISVSSIDGSKVDINRLRCFIFDALPKNIKVIKKSFRIDKENQPKVLKGSLMESIGIEMFSEQVCVRDQDVISKQSIKIHSKKTKTIQRRNQRRRSVNFKRKSD